MVAFTQHEITLPSSLLDEDSESNLVRRGGPVIGPNFEPAVDRVPCS
jgi:hypothetical protein